jgi:hypothetical protein
MTSHTPNASHERPEQEREYKAKAPVVAGRLPARARPVPTDGEDGSLDPRTVLALQRAAGNAAVTALLARRTPAQNSAAAPPEAPPSAPPAYAGTDGAPPVEIAAQLATVLRSDPGDGAGRVQRKLAMLDGSTRSQVIALLRAQLPQPILLLAAPVLTQGEAMPGSAEAAGLAAKGLGPPGAGPGTAEREAGTGAVAGRDPTAGNDGPSGTGGSTGGPAGPGGPGVSQRPVLPDLGATDAGAKPGPSAGTKSAAAKTKAPLAPAPKTARVDAGAGGAAGPQQAAAPGGGGPSAALGGPAMVAAGDGQLQGAAPVTAASPVVFPDLAAMVPRLRTALTRLQQNLTERSSDIAAAGEAQKDAIRSQANDKRQAVSDVTDGLAAQINAATTAARATVLASVSQQRAAVEAAKAQQTAAAAAGCRPSRLGSAPKPPP